MWWFGKSKSARAAVGVADKPDDGRGEVRSPILRAADIILDNRRAPISCLVRDVSESGLKLQFSSPHELPKYLHLILSHPREERLCEVIWRDETEVGLKFIQSIPPAD